MYGPGAGGFGGAAALDARALGAGPRLRQLSSASAFVLGTRTRLADLDLRTDLGHRIGSRGWWQGMATLGLLCGGAFWASQQVSPIPLPVRAPLTPSQAEELAPSAIGPLALGGVTGRIAAPTKLAEPLAEPPERPRLELTARLGTEGLARTLSRAGVGAADLAAVEAMLAYELDPAKLQRGTAFDLVLGRRDTKAVPRPLTSLAFRAAFDLRLEIARRNDGVLMLKRVAIRIDETPLRISGSVGSGLSKAARAAGAPAAQVAEAVAALRHAIDFERGVGRNDRFDLVLEHRRAETGETETGGLLYAALDPAKGDKVEMLKWRYDGKAQFFRANGESAKKGLMRTPVSGARQTSGFGMRFHPILNYSRLHQGIDFAAGSGTPIVAAAAGRVSFAGRHGGHGNYVRVQHKPNLATAYAHLSRFAVSNGAAVSQGQVIGYVGSTGMSTGPHLHYEVWLNGRPVNPAQVKFLGGIKLDGADYEDFKTLLDRLRSLPGG